MSAEQCHDEKTKTIKKITWKLTPNAARTSIISTWSSPVCVPNKFWDESRSGRKKSKYHTVAEKRNRSLQAWGVTLTD